MHSLEAVPNPLSFGDVPPTGVATQQLLLENTGQNLCVLAHLALDPRSDPGFSLPEGDLDDQLLSYPGDPDNPAGRPTVLTIPVQFASTALATVAAGAIDITAPNATPPDLTISLTASSAYGCFTVAPQSFDFGEQVFRPGLPAALHPPGHDLRGVQWLRNSRDRLPAQGRPRCRW